MWEYMLMYRLNPPHGTGDRGGPEFLAIIRHNHHNSLIYMDCTASMARVYIIDIISDNFTTH